MTPNKIKEHALYTRSVRSPFVLNDMEENEMDGTAHNAADHVRESYKNIETAVRYFGSFDHWVL